MQELLGGIFMWCNAGRDRGGHQLSTWQLSEKKHMYTEESHPRNTLQNAAALFNSYRMRAQIYFSNSKFLSQISSLHLISSLVNTLHFIIPWQLDIFKLSFNIPLRETSSSSTNYDAMKSREVQDHTNRNSFYAL